MKKFFLLFFLMTISIGQSQNLLTNGDFQNGTANWDFGSQGTVTSGEAFYAATTFAGNLWDTQLVQGGMSFTSGVTYSLSFKARAASDRNITVAIQNVGIWNDQFRQSYSLTTTMQTFTATFTAPFTNGNVQIGFLMAGQSSTAAVNYDDVVIEAVGGGGPTPPSQPVGLVANSPTSSSVFFACGPNNAGSGDVVYRLFYSPTATAPANPLTATQYTFGSTPGDGNGVAAFGFVLTGLNSGTPYTFWLYQFDTTTGLYSPPNSVTATTTSGTSVPQPVGFVANTPTSSSIFLAVGPNNLGGTIVYRLFYSPTSSAPANPLTATQYVFGTTPGDGNGTNAFGFNLGGLNSGTPYTFWLYQFNTATSTYSIPAIASNTTSNAAPALIPPTTNAPVPTRNPANVVSIYSNTYSNVVTDYDPGWGQSGHTLVNPSFEAVSGSGNTILHYPNFNYQGTELPATNLSDMEFLHVDLWTNAPASYATIKVTPINNGSGTAEFPVTLNQIQGQWLSVDIPKSAFSGMTWDSVFQMKFAANFPGSNTPIDIYLDNVYFWKNPGVSTDATLSDLQVDFATVSGFSPSTQTYTYNVPFGTTVIPQITSATTNNGAAVAVINQAASLPGSATVVVTAEDDSVQFTYTVNFAFPPPPAQPVGFVALNPTTTTTFLACGPNNVNGNIVYRLFYSPTASAPANPLTATEYVFGSTPGDGNGASPFGFVITGLAPGTNYTYWLYQYNTAENQFSVPGIVTLSTLCLPVNWYIDGDGDGFGSDSIVVTSCNSPGAAYVLLGGDCADDNAAINPGATEICYNNIDDNCNTTLSEGCAPVVVNMTPSYHNTTLSSLAIAVPAVPYYYAPYTNLKYRFSITNVTTGVTAPDIIQTSRFVNIPQALHAYNATYTIKASAVINDEVVPYAGNTITIFSPVVQLITLNSVSCGATLASLSSTLSANEGLNATGYTFRIRLTSDNGPTPTYATSPSATRFVSANSFTGFPLSYGTSYQVAVQYTFTDPVTSLPVDSGYGAECTVITPSIPKINLASPTCGGQVATLGANISATPGSYATSYQFRIRLTSDNGPTPTYYTTLPNASRFSSLSAFQGITFAYNANYSISVQYSIVNNSTTVWSGYGSECIVKTPFFPTTQLVQSQCGQEGATSLTQQLNIIAYPGFPNYKVRLTEVIGEDLGTPQDIVVTYPYFKLNQFSSVQLGKNYTVSVAIKQGGVFGDFSTECDLHTAAPTKSNTVVPFKATAYPNPFANNFMIDVKTMSQSTVNLKVYDMVGRLLEQRDVRVSDLETTTIGDRYPSGVYNVVVSQEDSVETVRVVKR